MAELRTATVDDLPRLADALADAFADDAVTAWLLPTGPLAGARRRALFAAELRQYGLAQGTVWTTAGVDGVAVALPPGAWEMPIPRTVKQTLPWVRTFGHRMGVAGRMQRTMEQRHLTEPHFYVRTVGVRRARQGRGLGSALMQPVLRTADDAGLPAYLEASSERSAALYERLGFDHLDVLELPDGGPPLWRMRRSPRR